MARFLLSVSMLACLTMYMYECVALSQPYYLCLSFLLPASLFPCLFVPACLFLVASVSWCLPFYKIHTLGCAQFLLLQILAVLHVPS